MTRALLLLLLAAAPAAGVTFAELQNGPAPRTAVYRTDGTNTLRAFWFAPDDWQPSDQRPAIVWIHGGAWVGGTLEGFMPHARYTAHRGGVGLNLEYRLARPEGPTLADCVADCRSALRFLRRHADRFGIDPRRIAVAGDSAGGHLAAALASLPVPDHPDDDPNVSARPDAQLLFNPVLDLTEDDWVRYAVGGPALADKTSPRPASPEALARARTLSPVFHVRPGAPPALLMHGRRDTVVPLSQAERFAAASRAASNRCDLVVLDHAAHAFVVAFWKSPEPAVVEAVRDADRFLASLGWWTGQPTLAPSPAPLWQPRPSSGVSR